MVLKINLSSFHSLAHDNYDSINVVFIFPDVILEKEMKCAPGGLY